MWATEGRKLTAHVRPEAPPNETNGNCSGKADESLDLHFEQPVFHFEKNAFAALAASANTLLVAQPSTTEPLT
jgi:hypothetical protein